jgi:radical SAM enzyme (TIGR01210 family)
LTPRLEVELYPDGRRREIVTVFLRNGRCPLTCVYCALYRQATDRPASGREIADQIDRAREAWPDVRGLKLYNASSFFEPRSIDQSEESFQYIARALDDLDLVVVEARSENARGAQALARKFSGHIEVAIGLETSDDALLRRMKKPTSTARFREAAAFLSDHGISLRAFVLVGPPFLPASEVREGAVSTFLEARRAGARVVSLLPVVSEHQPMEALRRQGFFTEVSLDDYFEVVCDCAERDRREPRAGDLLIADLDSLARLPGCPACRDEKTRRLKHLNDTGRIAPFSCASHVEA